MLPFADLEIDLRRNWAAPPSANPALAPRQYVVEMRLTLPNADTEERLLPEPGKPDAVFTIDWDSLDPNNAARYGTTLQASFLQGAVAEKFALARSLSGSAALRVRLAIDPQASELQALHWEAMADPHPTHPLPLFMNEQLAFSRYLSSQDFRDTRVRPRTGSLNALVVLSNPSDLAPDFNPIDPNQVLPGVRAALGKHIETQELVTPASATLDRIIGALQAGFDILYLICHGVTGRLFLEQDDGKRIGVDAALFVERIQALPVRPRLIVLASCQSAGDSDDDHNEDRDTADFTSSISPLLAAAGIPAVIGVRGKISVETATAFFGKFFEQLCGDQAPGQIDRAMSFARLAVKERRDFWMPALFMRLRSGMVWYVPGFSSESDLPWDNLCMNITGGQYVPVIGSELPGAILGSPHEIARSLAEAERFPLASWESADLAKVTQFVYRKVKDDGIRKDVRQAWMSGVSLRFPDMVPQFTDGRSLLDAVVAKRMEDPDDPYAILTSPDFRASLYIATTPDFLLLSALHKAGVASPVELFCEWRDDRQNAPEPQLTAGQTAIFYAYGKSEPAHEETWVLKEDDYLDYLIRNGACSRWPMAVSSAITQSLLLFLGFPVGDWSFRILLRMILKMQGAGLLFKKTHICVQVNPDETSFTDAIRAKSYFDTCFPQDPQIDIYWGTAAEFLVDLKGRLATYKAAHPPATRGASLNI